MNEFNTEKTAQNAPDIIIDANRDYGIPSIAVRGKIVFPNVFTTIDVGRLKTLGAVNAALKGDKKIFAVSQKDVKINDPSSSDLYTVGTVCRIGNLAKVGTDSFRLTVEGLYRAEIKGEETNPDYFVFNVSEIRGEDDYSDEAEAAFRVAKDMFTAFTTGLARPNRETVNNVLALEDKDSFINAATFNLPVRETDKQVILETVQIKDRLDIFIDLLNKEQRIADIQKSIAERVKKNVDKNQKEYYLREQIRAIREELGDDVDITDKLKEKVKAKGLPAESEEKVLGEIERMAKMSASSPDYTVLSTYVDWILDLPFKEAGKDTESLTEVKNILEEDHFGLEKVKERIVEYLAVYKLTGKLQGSILCLVGPPGVGKTSVARSVARALNRSFVRMSLGGVKDEAEIRGHRKTYIGAIPGRIIYGIKDAGTCNPVFLLDEIDKISSDLRGDPASALLEVLDPEQNSTFRDRYLEVPFDLSDVLFITTANTLETIPGPLLDRMEVIELSGYTREEKAEIAKRYLIDKQKKANGLEKIDISFSESAVNGVIDGYTREAGVRNLEREIGTICRKIACDVAKNGEKGKYKITETNLPKYLGIRKYLPDDTDLGCEVGSATGLAWTAVGGTTLTIEVALTPGKGEILLTGKLGDVMKESARAAISYLHANSEKFGINEELFGSRNIHIHVPEGATPKDGPSAGITMATALFSAFSGKAVNKNVAMTGEITLRGKVLPIGGLKEKALAAYRLGIRTVIIPKSNLKDLEEIPEKYRKLIEFVPVSDAEEVFARAIVGFETK